MHTGMRIPAVGPSIAISLILLTGLPVPSAAQVVNPTVAEFTPSADHSRVAADGREYVTHYELGFYMQGASSPFQVATIGKPTPAADGQIRVNLATLAQPSAGIVYQARVSAVGPGGSTPSTASNTFMFAVPCSYSVSNGSYSFSAAQWTGTVTVTAGTGCTWSAVSNNPSWLSVVSNANGTGGGTVSLAATANTSTSARTGTFTVAGYAITVTQAGIACTYGVSTTGISVPASGGTPSVSVTAPNGCSWTASGGPSWLSITSGSSGSGNGTVSLAASPNPGTSARSGTFTVAGYTITVTQAGITCTYGVSTTGLSVPASGGALSVSVTTPSGCSWSASGGTSWLSITSGHSGSGNGTVSVNAAAHTATSSRTATLTVAGQAVTVTQAGASCSYSTSRTSYSLPATAGGATLAVTAPAGCSWAASSDSSWLTITAATRQGQGYLSFEVSANGGTSARTGILSVAGLTIPVIQAGTSCSYAVSPTTHAIAAAGGTVTGSVATSTGCAWTTTGGASWLTVSSGRSGAGEYTLTASENTDPTPRSTAVTIAGREVSVTQSAAPSCTVSLSPGSITVGEGGINNGVVSVTAAADCAWTASSSQPWFSITSEAAGIGNAVIAIRVDPNTTGGSRSGTLTVGAQTIPVSQTGVGSPKGPKRVRIVSTK